MAKCELLNGCPFFNDRMGGMPATAAIYKKNYCEGDKSACARYMVFKALGKEHVPADLFPNQVDDARRIIAGT